MIDETGSMTDYIKGAKDEVLNISISVKYKVCTLNFNLGCIFYREHKKVL